MLDLAKHIVNRKAGRFDSEKFEDRYEAALIDPIDQERAGKPITPKSKPAASNVVDLMEALRRSFGQEATPARLPSHPRSQISAGARAIDHADPRAGATIRCKGCSQVPGYHLSAVTSWPCGQRKFQRAIDVAAGGALT
jgi:hypothetical protein